MEISLSYVDKVTIHANDRGKRLGRAVVTFDESSDAVLDDLYVDPKYEGQGVGGALIRDVVRLAEVRGKTAIYTNPVAYTKGKLGEQVPDDDKQPQIESFYRHRGFDEDEEGGNPNGGWVRKLT